MAFSTGRPNGTGGDNHQASHWKDDALNGGQYIGLMDPTDTPGQQLRITENDLRAFEAMGYQLDNGGGGGGGTTETLSTDDGTTEGGFVGDGVIFVNRLTPSQYPATLQTIRLFFGQFSNQPNPSGVQIKLIAFAGAAGSTRPPGNPQLLLNQTATLPTIGP